MNIQRYQRQSNSIKLKCLDSMSPAEQEMDDCESLPEVKRQGACVTTEEGDEGSFLTKKESSTKDLKNHSLKKSLVQTVTLIHCTFPQQLSLQRLW